MRRSHRRLSIAGTVVAGGTLAMLFGPMAAAASADTNYPPSDSCAATVLPSASGSQAVGGVSVSSAPSGCSQTGSGVQPAETSRTAVPSGNSGNNGNNAGTNSNTKSGGGLAFTGSDVPLVAGLGTVMVVGGVMIVVQSRRRQA